MYMQVEWCDPAHLDDYNEPILCWTKNNRCITFKETKNVKHWEWLVEKYGVLKLSTMSKPSSFALPRAMSE